MKVLSEKTINEKTLRVVQGDLTGRDTDAIVNAANSYLKHGGGVAGAIVRKGGLIIQQQSDKIGYVEVGRAAITGAGSLKARHVIHAVGPRMGEGDEDEKLRSAVRSSLELAAKKGLRSISLPAISSGIFGYPKERCAEMLVTTAKDYLKDNPDSSLKLVEFCLFDDLMAGLFVKYLDTEG